MSITLERIADLTGTSPATVSRAITGTGRVSEATRERILAVAKQFHYRPNLVARSMVSRSTKLIGVVLTQCQSGPFSRVISGIEHSARKAGYSVVFCQTEDDEQTLHEHLRLLACRRVDGVLFCPDLNTRTSLRALEQLGPEQARPPIVIVQEPFSNEDGYSSVVVDNQNGAKALGRHLVEHGYLDIGFVWMFPGQAVDERYAGFQAALKEAGQDPNRAQQVQVKLTPGPLAEDPYGYADPAWLSKTLAAHPHWQVLAASDDILAIKLIQALKTIGKRVPHDMPVVGFDDALVSAYTDPPLTTVDQPSGEIGRVACGLLLDLIAGKTSRQKVSTIRIPCSLRIRHSCGCNTTLHAADKLT